MITKWIDRVSLKNSSATVRAYAWELESLRAFFFDCDIALLSADDLAHYLVARRGQGAGDAALYRATCALRSFYQFVGTNAAAALPLKRPAKRVQRTLTWLEAERLIGSFDTSAVRGRRNLALCALLMDSALRAAELCRLEHRVVDLSTRLLRVVVKGGQEMFGVFSDECANFLAAWFSDRERIARCGRAFVDLRTGQGLTPDGLRCIFHRIGVEAGIEGLSPHVLRRTFATIGTQLGAPSRTVQVGGRWHDLKLVEDYTRALGVEAMRPYLPIAGIMRGQNGAGP